MFFFTTGGSGLIIFLYSVRLLFIYLSYYILFMLYIFIYIIIIICSNVLSMHFCHLLLIYLYYIEQVTFLQEFYYISIIVGEYYFHWGSKEIIASLFRKMRTVYHYVKNTESCITMCTYRLIFSFHEMDVGEVGVTNPHPGKNDLSFSTNALRKHLLFNIRRIIWQWDWGTTPYVLPYVCEIFLGHRK